MSDYLADERPITQDEFTRRACDPLGSVVVEACAGSGKTWLLVSRIIRALLAGHAPGEILAITFTRRAAQEMRARLMRDLQDLATADDAAVVDFLQQRGLAPQAAHAAIAPARHLFERVATAHVPITIETFHGWFWQLAQCAPLGAGVPFAPVLLASAQRLRTDAWLHFSVQLARGRHPAERAAWETLIDDIGDSAARALLFALLDKRAEWWCFAAGDEDAAVARALQPLRAAGASDPAAQLRAPAFTHDMQTLVDLWRAIAKPLPTIDQAIERAQQWLADSASDAGGDLRGAEQIMLTKDKDRAPRQILAPAAMQPRLSAAGGVAVQRYAAAHAGVIERLAQVRAARRTWRALQLNQAGFTCGRLLITVYQQLKLQQQALDFTDLEWHAQRLLADADHAAYMQARLDARYRQILLDEFQDTNPLQWQVLQGWLAAYGPLEAGGAGPADRPQVFIVGDPKQSIYRFRRAEPRVFDAACALLRRDFGAPHLRTNVTRRNAQAVIDVLNRSMAGGNALFQVQSTRARAAGAFVLLPLIPAPDAAPRNSGQGALRDVLTAARAERDHDSRYREGRVLANEIAHWVAQVRVREHDGLREARWSDVLVLVRRRTHLAHYEHALRDAGVPFVSDRRGGLLATLEADDLTALLEFLTAPFADLKLAHVLRSPLFGCSDLDLMRLAAAPGASWWQRLQHLVATQTLADADADAAAAGRGEGAVASAEPSLVRAQRLLSQWLALAGRLPVHDLLDHIYFASALRSRYAALVPAALHRQVQANLDAFLELALAVDAGRYPSLPRFVDEIASLRRDATDDAPDEGTADAGDAVRVMTIHGAKGLEADIVVLADAHVPPAADGAGVLVVWPPQQSAPEHVSLVARGEVGRDAARAAWFAQDDAQRAQEDWNLLYVAATRARQVLIVSGCTPARGTPDDTWYTRLQAAADLSAGAAPAQPPRMVFSQRAVRDFLPSPLPTGQRLPQAVDSEALRLGGAWHMLLELGEAASAEAVARAHSLSPAQMQRAVAAASTVRTRLPQFFGAGAAVELDLMSADGTLLRVDRLVEQPAALWIIDFKWRVTAAERPQYEAQVRRYAEVLRSIRCDKPVRMGLITADGALTEVLASGPVDTSTH